MTRMRDSYLFLRSFTVMDVSPFPYPGLLPELRNEVSKRLGRSDRTRLARTAMAFYGEDVPLLLHDSVLAALTNGHEENRKLLGDVLRAIDLERAYNVAQIEVVSLGGMYLPPRRRLSSVHVMLPSCKLSLVATLWHTECYARVAVRYRLSIYGGIELFPYRESVFSSVSAFVSQPVIRVLIAPGVPDVS